MNKFTPIDMPRNKCFGSNYYETYSLKLKRNVKLYSELEYKNFLTLEMNPEVVEYCEQPLKIDIEIDGMLENSIFDVWVHYRNGTEEMQEVKYTEDIDPKSVISKRARRQIFKQEQWCKEKGYAYLVRTEKVIETGTYYINNLRYLYGVVKRLDMPLYRRYIQILKSKLLFDKVIIKDIVSSNVLPFEAILQTIVLGIYEGQIKANLDNKIFSYDTEIWLKSTYSEIV